MNTVYPLRVWVSENGQRNKITCSHGVDCCSSSELTEQTIRWWEEEHTHPCVGTCPSVTNTIHGTKTA